MKQRVICVRNQTIERGLLYDMVQVGKQYDMARIRLVDYEGNMYPDNTYCYIYEGSSYFRVPLELFELVDEYRNKKIDSIIK